MELQWHSRGRISEMLSTARILFNMRIMEFSIYYWQELPFHPLGPAHGLKESVRKWWMLLYRGSLMAQCWNESHTFPGVAVKSPWKSRFSVFAVWQHYWFGYFSLLGYSHTSVPLSPGQVVLCLGFTPGLDQFCKWRCKWKLEVVMEAEPSLAINPNLAGKNSSWH